MVEFRLRQVPRLVNRLANVYGSYTSFIFPVKSYAMFVFHFLPFLHAA